jgi:hypothetical protein
LAEIQGNTFPFIFHFQDDFARGAVDPHKIEHGFAGVDVSPGCIPNPDAVIDGLANSAIDFLLCWKASSIWRRLVSPRKLTTVPFISPAICVGETLKTTGKELPFLRIKLSGLYSQSLDCIQIYVYREIQIGLLT